MKPRKPLKQLPYRGTKVPYDRSQRQIREMLRKYEIHNVSHPMGFNDQLVAYVCATQFMYTFPVSEEETKTLPIVIMIQMGSKPSDGREYDQEANQLYRAIHWYIKSRLEAVEFGFDVLEEFLSHIKVRGPDGQMQQMYHLLLPKLSQPALEHKEEVVKPPQENIIDLGGGD